LSPVVVLSRRRAFTIITSPLARSPSKHNGFLFGSSLHGPRGDPLFTLLPCFNSLCCEGGWIISALARVRCLERRPVLRALTFHFTDLLKHLVCIEVFKHYSTMCRLSSGTVVISIPQRYALLQ